MIESNRYILLTGATGFLGSNIAHKLIEEGFTVYATVREGSSTARISDILGGSSFNVVKPEDAESAFKSRKIDAVIHTATSYGRTGETFADVIQTNIEFPLRLLECAIANGARCFVNSDTFLPAGVGGPRNRRYTLTKKAFLGYAREVLIPSFAFVNMRIEQMYGPDDNPTKFIPALIGKFLSGAARIPLNPGEQKRDYVYVDDVAEAYVKAVSSFDKLSGYQEFGIGTGRTHTLKELAAEIAKAAKSPAALGFGDVPYAQDEIMLSCADTGRNGLIGWKAVTSLSDGIARTVAFYQARKILQSLTN